MLSQSPGCSVRPLRLGRAPLVGRGLCSSLLVLLALGAVSNSWAVCNYTVGSTADSGGTCPLNAVDASCTLRQAILNASTSSSTTRTICFAENLKGTTITLSSELSIVSKNLNIIGYGGNTSANNGITISGNNAYRIFNIGGLPRTVVIDGLILVNAKPVTANGGAITTVSGQNVTIKNSTFKNNQSIVSGGAIFMAGTGTVDNCTFEGNQTAQVGGAIYITGTLTLTNSTFYGNVATSGGGGGLYAEEGASVELYNNTFSNNNYTTVGGAIYVGQPDSSAIANNIFANSLGSAKDCAAKNGTAFFINANNLIENNDSTNSCLTSGAGNISGDPSVSGLANNGGPTQTMAISSSSPAYNAGDNIYCPGTDQRGVTRPQYTTCDIGSYEASAKAGGGKLTLVKYGDCSLPCADSLGTYPPDSTYPQLSMKGVCWAYVNLKNTSGYTLSNITFELTSITNNNWLLNTDTIPMQGGNPGAMVLSTTTPTGCNPTPPVATGTASSLANNQTINAWYKVGVMNTGKYYISTRIRATTADGSVTPMSAAVTGGLKRVISEDLGELTLDFNDSKKAVYINDPDTMLIQPEIGESFMKRYLND